MARRTARRSRPWRGTRRPRLRRAARPAHASSPAWPGTFPWLRSLACSSDRDLLHPQRRLADADRHALAVLAAGADAGIEREIVAHHGNAMQIGRSVADQHRALERRADLAVLDLIGLGALEDVFARGDVDLSAAEAHRIGRAHV